MSKDAKMWGHEKEFKYIDEIYTSSAFIELIDAALIPVISDLTDNICFKSRLQLTKLEKASFQFEENVRCGLESV